MSGTKTERLGAPEGFFEWSFGDETARYLASYNRGEESVPLTRYDLEVMAAITSPDLDCIFRGEFSELFNEHILTIYIAEGQLPYDFMKLTNDREW